RSWDKHANSDLAWTRVLSRRARFSSDSLHEAGRLTQMRRPRSMEISSFTLKGSLIPETYAAFQAWDFDLTVSENYERFKQENTLGARSANWLRDVVFVLHRRFDPVEHDRALVVLAQTHCPLEIWKPILLWHMTRDEFLLRDFAVRWLAAEFLKGRYSI